MTPSQFFVLVGSLVHAVPVEAGEVPPVVEPQAGLEPQAPVQEAVGIAEACARTDTHSEFVACFDSLDLNKDGYLSRDELNHLLKESSKEWQHAHKLLKQYDRNDDG